MRKVLAFRAIVVDSMLFPAGTQISAGESFAFFSADDHEEEEVITEKKKTEEAVIKWLLGSRSRQLLLEELGVEPSSFVDYSVTRPVIENPQEKPGDIDILICDGNRAEHAIAIQCKPVSVVAFDQDEDDVNKLPDIRVAVLQANKQREKLGFYKNYLAVIVKAYGRKRQGSNVLFRGPTRKTFQQI